MRKLTLLLLLISAAVQSNSQKIYGYEYWVDDNLASKVNTSVVPPVKVFRLQADIPISNVSEGYHYLNFRFIDSTKRWSSVFTRYFVKYPSGISLNKQIIAFEYWVDDGYNSKVYQAVTPSMVYHYTDNLNFNNVSSGYHYLNFRFKDNLGEWSSVLTQYFVKYPSYPTSGKQVVAYEYWVDDSYGSKIYQAVTSSPVYHFADNLNLNNVSSGYHYLNFRFKDNHGEWSAILTQYFLKFGQVVLLPRKIEAYRYWFDNDPAGMETISFPLPSQVIHLNDTVEMPFLTIGQHVINYQFKDTNHIYSSARTDTFNVTSCLPHGGRAITGSASVCVGQQGVVYSIRKIRNAGSYTWSVPSGATIVAGNNTQSIMVNYAVSAVSGNVSVYATNSCGNGETMIFPVAVHQLPLPSLAGKDTVCSGTSGWVYSTETGKSNYTWSISPGNIITAGGTSTSPTTTIKWNSTGQQWIRVNYANEFGCTAATDKQFDVFVKTSPLPPISGPSSVCVASAGNGYSTDAGKSGYLWTVTPGGTITSGAGTSTITVAWNNSGTQMVTVNYASSNGCTAPVPTYFNVNVNPLPAASGAITGPGQVIQGQTAAGYSVSAVANATGYAWSLPTGATISSGGNTNSIVADFSAVAVSGDISVHGTNTCGNGAESQGLTIHVIPTSVSLANISVGTGQSNCYSAAKTIYVAGSGTTFEVKTGGSATMIAGQNILYRPTTTVSPGGYMHGYITTSSQFCGTQPAPLMAVVAGTEALSPPLSGASFKVYPNPTTGSFTLEFTDKFPSGKVEVEIYNMQGEKLSAQEITGEHSHLFSLLGRPAGLYIVRVFNGTKEESVRIIRQ